MYEQDPAEVEDLSDGAGMSSEDTGKISQHKLLTNTQYRRELFVSIIQELLQYVIQIRSICINNWLFAHYCNNLWTPATCPEIMCHVIMCFSGQAEVPLFPASVRSG